MYPILAASFLSYPLLIIVSIRPDRCVRTALIRAENAAVAPRSTECHVNTGGRRRLVTSDVSRTAVHSYISLQSKAIGPTSALSINRPQLGGAGRTGLAEKQQRSRPVHVHPDFWDFIERYTETRAQDGKRISASVRKKYSH
ncbi:hypothetical protein C8Q69DRAFT_319477 [Paecilomyces variotii]|uniref:Uncharacterized protein n=1 Tax=Byssochlamys spectabilis TaxID=264951 RepID=A0A443HQT9_BYSSP|nr:hypothetical protein C8Q69DRAFT_319477 [Paecilomyces variotii]RWQ94192.1 hypothetical protein C8Q69DRAFT_319477 [Paecilomyces variotii]